MNLQNKLDNLLADIKNSGKTPSLMLHTCCAPCASYVLEYLSPYFAITALWYNPNILPEDEHSRRFAALQHLLQCMSFPNKVELVQLPDDPEDFREAVRGLEGKPEGKRRCEVCFRLRLERTAKLAAQYRAEYFATTLSVGPRKNVLLLHEISAELSEGYGVAALPCDFKKRGGYARSVELSREMGVYRQGYCGCGY